LVDSTTYTGESRTITNPFTLEPITASVHKFTTETMPAVPAEGDILLWNALVDVNRPDIRYYYDEIIASMAPIPFPGHLSTPLPMPWVTP
jgi:hypothetical protein